MEERLADISDQRCNQPSANGLAHCLRAPHPHHSEAHVWELDIDHLDPLDPLDPHDKE